MDFEIHSQEEDTITLDFKSYDPEDFTTIASLYRTGMEQINESATTVVLNLCVNVLQHISKDLSEISSAGKLVSYSTVRRFAVSCTQLDMVELVLFAAFQAPRDDLFYLPADHPHWQQMFAHTHEHGIENYDKYRSQLKFTMNSISAAGAAAFRAMEEESLVKQGWQAATHGAYYRIMDEEGNA